MFSAYLLISLEAAQLFHDGGCYHIETSPIDLQRKSMIWFLYDNGLRHERVKNLEHAYICFCWVDW